MKALKIGYLWHWKQQAYMLLFYSVYVLIDLVELAFFVGEMSESVFYGQLGAFMVGFVSSVTCTVTCCWNLWSITSDGDSASVLGAIWGFNGIWIQCVQHTSGAFQCNHYGTAVFNLPPYINAIRAFMCIAVILSVMGCLLSLVGMQASRLLETAPDLKRVIIQVTGSFFITAGLLTLASLGWFAGITLTDFFSPQDQDNMMRYTLGATFYLGIGSAMFSLCAGIMFLCLPGPKEDDETEYDITPIARAPNTAAYRTSISKRPLYTDYNLESRRNTVQYV